MDDQAKNFGNTAKQLARNPLGIIALFLVLVYGLAAFVTYSSTLTPSERLPLIYFLIFFPVVVLVAFTWLVSKHSGKLFAPSDFKNEENYIMMQRSVSIQTVESKTLEASSSLARIPAVENDEDADRLQAAKDYGVPIIVQEQEKIIQESLKKLNLNGNQNETVNILVRHLAVAQLCLRAESIYRTIFGSQIILLKFLNTVGSGTKAELLQFYENAKNHFPALYETYPFEQYLQYMLLRVLITTEDHEHYFITFAGKEFLKWITEMSLSEDKPF